VDKKGFTLMELMVSLFISGMVTVALMAVWRTASVQTVQGQRRGIIFNNMSIFSRGLRYDMDKSTAVLWPRPPNDGITLPENANGHFLLVGAFNAYEDGKGNLVPGLRDTFGTPQYFYYCVDRKIFNTGSPVTANIRRKAVPLTGPVKIETLLENTLARANPMCDGNVVLNNVTDFTYGEIPDEGATGTALITFTVYKDFKDGSPQILIRGKELLPLPK
jgi:prepilin-type N-terminal cleavage/methylation domain-containing protein